MEDNHEPIATNKLDRVRAHTATSVLLAALADLWRKAGHEHPFGENFRRYVNFVPERYDRKTLEEAIAAVPAELVDEGTLATGRIPWRSALIQAVPSIEAKAAHRRPESSRHKLG